ncbi:hypothetical protein K7A41_09840 [Sphingobacterium sp. InxBP1]|uniref:hypothetical protein n=1 Tax=Sphingobacterium sp. InxBP1 TaxID=2870328 RepID=UPI002243EA66|nr:hypothetical protein [Sphingobacterium sp. InxBP1]MCW8311523.1 hypothetical protein [Sphingobacterium sp. InxBP1]
MKLIDATCKNIFALLSGFTLFISCQSEGPKIIALEQLDKTFNVSAFYIPKVKKTAEILALDVKSLDKSELKEVFETATFKKDTLAFFDTQGSLPTAYYLESTSNWETRNRKPHKYFGYRYTTVSYHEDKDTLAVLNGVAFPAVSMAESEDGQFAYLHATKSSKNQTDYAKIRSFLQEQYKPLPVTADVSTGISGWESEDFYYFLSKKERKEEQIFSFGEEAGEENTSVNISDILLEIYSKTYIQRMREEKAYLRDYIPVVH